MHRRILVSEAGYRDLVHHVIYADDIAHDPEHLVEDVDRLDLSAHVRDRPDDRDANAVSGDHVRRPQRLDDIRLELIVSRQRPVLRLDIILALELERVRCSSPGDVCAALALACLAEHSLGGRHVRDAFFGGDEVIIGIARGRLVDQITAIFGR